MKANYKPLTRSEAKKIAREEVNSAYQELFAECAAERWNMRYGGEQE